MRPALVTAAVGAVVGLVVGLVGEAATWAVFSAFPGDVAMVQFAVTTGVVGGAVVGGLCGWRGWLSDRLRLVAMAMPGLVAGVGQVAFQWLISAA